VSQMPWLVVGLGNPGPEYAATRHNIGAMVIDVLAERGSVKLAKHRRAHASAADVRVGEHRTELLISRTYMNESGGPVKAAMDFAKISPDQLIVLHDELDLPFADLRCKLGGGDNGHNGLRSIRQAIGTGDFLRVRLGIGRPPGRQDPASFVLKAFSATERKALDEFVDRGADAVESLINSSLEATQNLFNN